MGQACIRKVSSHRAKEAWPCIDDFISGIGSWLTYAPAIIFLLMPNDDRAFSYTVLEDRRTAEILAQAQAATSFAATKLLHTSGMPISLTTTIAVDGSQLP